MNKIYKILISLLFLMISALPVYAIEKSISMISGDGQTGIRGYPLKNEYIVRVLKEDGSPVWGALINFNIVNGSTEEKSFMSSPTVYTDKKGYAKSTLHLSKNAPEEILVMASSNGVNGNIVFKSRAFNKNWPIMMLVNIAGGLALLLFGMTFINDALQKAAGEKFRAILNSLTSSKIKGVLSGFLLTSLNQSSSATMLLTVGLVGAGLLTFFQSMSISLGASIGSTVTAQLVAFRLVDYALPIIAVGYFISFISGGKRLSKIADAIFGFGILFFGMKLMSNAMVPITLNPTFLDFIIQMESPILAILAGIAITLIIQSSGAVVGIVIAMATSNVMTLMQAICIALGSQIGTCITVIIGSLKMPRSAKRTVIWQVIHQTIAVILVFPFLQVISINGEGTWLVFVKKFTKTFFFTEDIGRQIAMSHTLVAVLNTTILLPILKYLQKAVFFFYPFKNEEMSFGTVFIDLKNIEKNTDNALELSKREIQRLGEFVSDMLYNSIKALKTRDITIPENISKKALKIELLSKEIIPYIAKIGQRKLTAKQSQTEIQLLYILSSLDEIADIVDRSLMDIAKKKIRSFSRFSDEGLADIKRIHSTVYENFVKVLNAFNENDKELAKEVANLKQEVGTLESELKQKHIARLHANLQESISTSGLHMDILDQYTRINAIVCDIGNLIASVDF